MVLPDARAELREALAALVAGRLTNDEFDDIYDRLCFSSPDRGVQQIGEFGSCLYSSETFLPCRLTGRNALCAEARAIAERCDLFLRSDLKYEWPPHPNLGWVQLVQVVLISPGLLVSVFALALVSVALSNSAWGAAGAIAAVGVLAFLPGLLAYRLLGQYAARRESEYWSSGSREVWPFFSEAEFQLLLGQEVEPDKASDPPA